MKTLILETSSEKGLIALVEGGTPIDVKQMVGGPELSKTLALEVTKLLNGCRPDGVTVGTGPGSYTGIRVGAALGKALAFGWEVPLFGFSSLSAFAPPDRAEWAVLVDARIGGVYVLKNGSPATLLSIAQAEAELSDIPLLASPHPDLIKKRLSLKGRWVETSPDPRVIARGKPSLLTLSYLAFP